MGTDTARDAAREAMEDRDPACAHFERAAGLIGKRWTVQVVRALQSGPMRFSEVKAAIPAISDALLSERLKELEREGLVNRTVTPQAPVRVTYELTEAGTGLGEVMDGLGRWAARWHLHTIATPEA